MAQILALRLDCLMEKPCYRGKTPLVVGGTRTQVLADSWKSSKPLRHLNLKPRDFRIPLLIVVPTAIRTKKIDDKNERIWI